MARALTFSSGIQRIPHLGQALGVSAVCRLSPWSFGFKARQDDVVVGWGVKSNTARARRFAQRHGLSYLDLEDGFLRSIDLGVRGSPSYAFVVDPVGVYYDARQPSLLENLLNGTAAPFRFPWEGAAAAGEGGDSLGDPALLQRARDCIARIRSARLSKYNSSPVVDLGERKRPRVLVVDQVGGDMSIHAGLSSAERFSEMLAAALSEHPDAEVLVKTHPDVLNGRKAGHLPPGCTASERVRFLTEEMNPIGLLEQIDHVYVVTSQLGFEALMMGRPVSCFGAPFYAGWGLTDDRVEVPRRVQRRSLEQVFAAAYILYSRYIDPDSGEPCEIERVIDHLALQRQAFERNQGRHYGFGFGFWKQGYVRNFLRCPWGSMRFDYPGRTVPADTEQLLVWGVRDTPRRFTKVADRDIPVWRVEDGFLRSVGLGVELNAPSSLVVDHRGIYFDPRGPSDLEHILETSDFSESDRVRARALIAATVDGGISKYNVGVRRPLALAGRRGRQVILVPGQVENDASIRAGCRDIADNKRLLQAVREENPDAYILYKPHPDVLSGNRPGGLSAAAGRYFDLEVTDTALADCLEVADEVHTMTSLVGFEALLRGKRVVTYGLPFYAGWGLTRDRHATHRRTRQLSLEELVAGCLIHYPLYVNHEAGHFTTPEYVIACLRAAAADTARRRLSLSAGGRVLRKLRHFLAGAVYSLSHRH